jgi:hypothetical protein
MTEMQRVESLMQTAVDLYYKLQMEKGGRVGYWMPSYSGKRIYPLDPRGDDIDIVDIFHALSSIARYNGHADWTWTVGDHSILMFDHLMAELGLSQSDDARTWSEEHRKLSRTCLLHDATEAYLCDIVRPLKHNPLMSFYRALEDDWSRMISMKYDLIYPLPGIIKKHDELALMTERRDIVSGASKAGWTGDDQEAYPTTIRRVLNGHGVTEGRMHDRWAKCAP